MDKTVWQAQKQYVDVGDRIAIQSHRLALVPLTGKFGTVVAVFTAPRGSCVVRIDEDWNGQREQFFYRDEIALADMQ